MWHNSLGTCNVKAKFNKGAKELALSLFQVCAVCQIPATSTHLNEAYRRMARPQIEV